MNDDINKNACEIEGDQSTRRPQTVTDNFTDLYEFLGIPPNSAANLIYLAARKLESHLSQKPAAHRRKYEKLLALVKNTLLNTNHRSEYESEWERYYFPLNKHNNTNLSLSLKRNQKSHLLRTGLKQKSHLLVRKPKCLDEFDYSQEFRYMVMCDREKGRDIFFLDPKTPLNLSPLPENIFFEERQFHLRSYASSRVFILNDALGKNISVHEKCQIPLHIGDRIEFENGTRLILRGFYDYSSSRTSQDTSAIQGLYFEQERVLLPLDPEKIYIVGRNTSDIRNLSFKEEVFRFINIGRRERSISRQNFQIFYRHPHWYVLDLGSRYGTTLSFSSHEKMETLVGGGIMRLENGEIRLGYDKSYIINFGAVEELNKLQQKTKVTQITPSKEPTIYDLALL